VTQFISAAQFEALFLHRNDPACESAALCMHGTRLVSRCLHAARQRSAHSTPHAPLINDPNTGASNGFYTYAAFTAAAAAFPGFGTSSTDAATNKRELAAFLAHISHETTGGWPTAPDGPYSWGLCWVVEGGRTPPVAPYCAATAEYPCAAGKAYYGRGPMQLSWK
jgi:hypothetical protein